MCGCHTAISLEHFTGFLTIATTSSAHFAGIARTEKPLYGIQFHPDVTHNPRGKDILGNFAVKLIIYLFIQSRWTKLDYG
jgi:GMP synthase-like glutamine amidotransferase